jgi:hypothetical protein
MWSSEPVIKNLLEHGADPTLKDSSGRTPESLAEERGIDIRKLIQAADPK